MHIFGKWLSAFWIMGSGAATAAALPDHRLVDHLAAQATSSAEVPKKAGLGAKRNMVCMALTLYHEARGVGKREEGLIAHVVLNRTHEGAWGSSVCTTVYAPHPSVGKPGRAFSWVHLHDRTPYDLVSWHQALSIAVSTVRHPHAPDPTHGANFFTLPSVPASWARHLRPVLRAHHLFYQVAVASRPVLGARAPEKDMYMYAKHRREVVSIAYHTPARLVGWGGHHIHRI